LGGIIHGVDFFNFCAIIGTSERIPN